MNIGERIRFFRNRKHLTQQQLGLFVGFPESSAEVRIAQYEAGKRKPKAELTEALANVLSVSPLALRIPDIESPLTLIHTLFALEDIFGSWPEENNGAIAVNIDPYNNEEAARLFDMFRARNMITGGITIQVRIKRFQDRRAIIISVGG